MSAAARCAANNVAWYEAVLRPHGAIGAVEQGMWVSDADLPPYYSNAVTVAATPVAPQVATVRRLVARLDRPFAVKDSFACLDLEPLGFSVLFEAQWIWRDPSRWIPIDDGGAYWQPVTTPTHLAAWEAAWRENGSPTDRPVFLPALLADPAVRLFAAYRGGSIVAGCAANRSDGVVGFSNIFAAEQDANLLRAGAAAQTVAFAQGLPIVGFEGGEALARAQTLGFQPVGLLRVWTMTSPSHSG